MRVLIGVPVHERHRRYLNPWLRHLARLERGPDDQILFVVDDLGDEFTRELIMGVSRLGIWGVRYTDLRHTGLFVPGLISTEKIYFDLARKRNLIRRYVLENRFEAVYLLDSDIFVTCDSLRRLKGEAKGRGERLGPVMVSGGGAMLGNCLIPSVLLEAADFSLRWETDGEQTAFLERLRSLGFKRAHCEVPWNHRPDLNSLNLIIKF